MIRVTMIFLCLILAGAAAGRYQAEVRVKQKREEIRELDRLKAREVAEIQLLRAEIAYLESPERLAIIAQRATNLKPLMGAQLLTANDFAVAFGGAAQERPAKADDVDTILRAIAMADGSVTQ